MCESQRLEILLEFILFVLSDPVRSIDSELFLSASDDSINSTVFFLEQRSRKSVDYLIAGS